MTIKNKHVLLSIMLILGTVLLLECRSNTENKNIKTDTIPKIKTVVNPDTIIKIKNTDTLPHKKAVEKINSTINVKNMEYPTVTNTFETFDFERYEKRPPADENGYRDPTYVQHLQNGIVG